MFWPLIILIFTLLFLLPLALVWKSFAPWVPTKTKDMKRIFALAELRPGDHFYDLGSGDGKMVLFASKHFGAQSTGLELALPLVLISRFRVYMAGEAQAKIKWKNLFKENLDQADVVYVFGITQSLQERFQKKLEGDLKPGARVISYAFKIGNLTPVVTDQPTSKHLPIYVYQF
jgi:cyclopropane fatty-acyl-phospholipid synthase-like methyltransferase